MLDTMKAYGLRVTDDAILYSKNGLSQALPLPVFPIQGLEMSWTLTTNISKALHRNGMQWDVSWQCGGVKLHAQLQAFRDTPILRIRYGLSGNGVLQGPDGQRCIRYMDLNIPYAEQYTTIELSHFDRLVHAYLPHETTIREYAACSFAGPILMVRTQGGCVYAAYEHGATMPDHYLGYHFDGVSRFSLCSRKGNFFDRQALSDYRAPWLQLGLIAGDEMAAKRALRDYYLHFINPNAEPAKPYIYYNTWGHQNRIHRYEGQAYLAHMNDARMLAEIDAAHQMGVDVFVIDTGWYKSAGEYEADLTRLAGGLSNIKARLDQYGMKLGLWFDPSVASVHSRYWKQNPQSRVTSNGKPINIGVMWESEECEKMCIASDYSDLAIQTMLEAHSRYGVTYFKWDGIHQYLCDDPGHWHGTADNSSQERYDCFAYRMGLEMIRIAESASQKIPQIIIDFDVTESQRFFGMGFLAVGKFFYCNESVFPTKIPEDPNTDLSDPQTLAAVERHCAMRSQACRQSLRFDTLFPSTLFMTHFSPDRPYKAQKNAMASMVLGPNGVWGDIVELDEQDRAMIRGWVDQYKAVAQSVTKAYPRVCGQLGYSPEIHEKLDPVNAQGMVVFFTHEPGRVTHVTVPIDEEAFGSITGADEYRLREDHRLEITVNLAANDARVVYVLGKDFSQRENIQP